MPFEEVLANCLADLEQGRSVEACLAQYPAYAAELAPILEMISPMRRAPKPRLSPRAFARGRAAVAAYARQQQQLREPFIASSPRAVQTRSFATQSTPRPGVKAAQIKPPPAPVPPRSFRPFYRGLSILVALLLVITFATFVRGVTTSLPGSFLYPVKGWGEHAQRLLMVASGQEASWHVNQLTRRLTELAQLTQQGAPIEPTLHRAIEEHLQAALEGSNTLPLEQRQQFLTAWLNNLHALQQDLPTQAPTVATLNRAIAAVEQAAQDNNGPTILPPASTPTPTPQATSVATYTPTAGVTLPTLTPTDTALPETIDPAAPLTETVTLPTPTPDVLITATVEAAPGSPTPLVDNPTITLTPLASTPTATQSPQLMPEEGNRGQGSDDSSDNDSSPPTPTAPPVTPTPAVTLQPPHIPMPTGSGTTESGTPAAETPAVTEEAPVPGGLPTSAEPPTPVPTGTKSTDAGTSDKTSTPAPTRNENKPSTPEPTKAEATPTPKAATATPSRGDNKGSTPEPTKAENSAPTNTSKPEETKAETPTPDDDDSGGEETPAPSTDSEQPTPEPTPTPKKKK